MDNDSIRNKIDARFYCSKHPKQQLTFSCDSRVGASSAHEINVKIIVHPCSECLNEVESVRKSVKTLFDFSEEKE